MAINRQVVLKSRVLRTLVAGGMDKRQMVRQLCRCESVSKTSYCLGGAFVWSAQPQGLGYWHAIAKRIGEYA